ncbi:MAG: ABC transporter ATP-binding protein [Syntrophorhabdaceae bacterium]|nr:ABC transporter ATP-binding protein [Syntrophorhabdaceae bacterium]
MIRLRDVTKTYNTNGRKRIILEGLNIDFVNGVNVGILGRNGSGKTTLMRIIGGTDMPDSGTVQRTSRISWPIGFSGCFHGSLTGRENLRFVCRLYGANWKNVTEFVEDFSELGIYMNMPVKSYSSGMRAKLAFGLSMAIGFDFYLIDEVTAVGDASFSAKSAKVFSERKATSTLLVVSHNISTVKAHCDVAGVLDDGHITFYDKIDEAIIRYDKVCKQPTKLRFV